MFQLTEKRKRRLKVRQDVGKAEREIISACSNSGDLATEPRPHPGPRGRGRRRDGGGGGR
eukprot:9173144-Pyramimonas_sp.AAC.1